MPRRTVTHVRLFAATVATVGLIGAGVSVPMAAHADTIVDVATVSAFETAFEDVAGSSIRLTADITSGTYFEQADGITVTVDLNGFDLSVISLHGGNGSYLFITDSTPEGGTLNAVATYGLYPGIYTAQSTLQIDGTANVVAVGAKNQPGIGGSTNGIDPVHDGGSIIIGGDAVVNATAGSTIGDNTTAAAGIGGSESGKGATIFIGDNAEVYAIAGFGDFAKGSGAGIGGGHNGDGGFVDISGNAKVTAIGRKGGAGIGSGRRFSQSSAGGGTVRIKGAAQVTARSEGLDPDNLVGAGIGGGSRDLGATVTVENSAVVDATGGNFASAIGGGQRGNGKSFVSSGTSVITAKSGINSIGYGLDAASPSIGTVTIGAGSTVIVPAASQVNVPNGQQVTNNGTIVSNHVLAGLGTIVNNGTIIDRSSISPTVKVTNHNYQVQLQPQAGELDPASSTVGVFAASLAAGERSLPTPTRAGYSFTGWNTEADGSGTWITAASDISGLGSSTGLPIIGVLFAQYEFIKLASTTAVTLSPPTVTAGETASATATVGAAASGTISFSIDGGTPFATAAAPTATVAIPASTAVGSHTITATYSGDSTYLGSTSSAGLTVIAAAVTDPPAVKKVTPKVTVSAKRFAKNSKPKVTVRLSSLGSAKKATGKIAVFVGKKKVKTVSITNKTVVRVTLPKKYSKTITVRAKFLGSTTIAAKVSKTVKLRVR